MPAHYIGEHVVISGTVEGGRRLNWGQKLKSSMRVYVFRSASNNGHRATTAACPKSAISGLASLSRSFLVGSLRCRHRVKLDNRAETSPMLHTFSRRLEPRWPIESLRTR
jgi:hypothetical protein